MNAMIDKINLRRNIKEIGGKPWSPIDMVRVNDQVVRLVLFKGELMDILPNKGTTKEEVGRLMLGLTDIGK